MQAASLRAFLRPSRRSAQVTDRIYVPFGLDFDAYPVPSAPPPRFTAAPRSFADVFGSATGALPLEVYDPWDLAVAGGSASLRRLRSSCVEGCGAGGVDAVYGAEWCAGCDAAGALVAAAKAAAGDDRPALIVWLRRPADYLPDGVTALFVCARDLLCARACTCA